MKYLFKMIRILGELEKFHFFHEKYERVQQKDNRPYQSQFFICQDVLQEISEQNRYNNTSE